MTAVFLDGQWSEIQLEVRLGAFGRLGDGFMNARIAHIFTRFRNEFEASYRCIFRLETYYTKLVEMVYFPLPPEHSAFVTVCV